MKGVKTFLSSGYVWKLSLKKQNIKMRQEPLRQSKPLLQNYIKRRFESCIKVSGLLIRHYSLHVCHLFRIGRWSVRLILDIRPWIGRKFEEVNYYVTQMLSDHGYFRNYLHRLVKAASSYCLYEEGEVIDNAMHTVFEYAHWQSYRSVLMSIIGMITVANIVRVMIASRGN